MLNRLPPRYAGKTIAKGQTMILKDSRRQLKTWIFVVAGCFTGIIMPASARAIETQQSEPDGRTISYPEMGVTTGAAYLNLNFGYWHKRMGLRVAGGYLGADRNGLRLNLGYKLRDSETRLDTLNIVLGNYVGRDPGARYDYAYIGLTYGLNYRGWYAELGLAKDVRDRIGNLRNDPILPCGTVGYLHRFR